MHEDKYESERIELEQNLFEAQQLLESVRLQLQEKSSLCKELKEAFDRTEKEKSEKAKLLFETEASRDELLSNKKHLELKCEYLNDDKGALSKVLEERREEIARLQDELRSVKAEVKTLTIQKCEQQVKVDEIESRAIYIDHKEKRWEHERNLLMCEKEHLQRSILEREQQVFQLRRELNSKTLDSQTALDLIQNEKLHLESTVTSLKQENDALNEQVDDLNQRLKQATETQSNIEMQHEQEIVCQNKLISVLKESCEEAENKVEELTKALENMQNLFQEAKNAHFVMQETLKTSEIELAKVASEKDAEITDLKEELEKANELLRSKHRVMLSDEEIAALSPGAAAAGKLIKSGHTLTNIYRQHMKVVEELESQKVENKRLEQYFRELVHDIEEKAPILKQQEEEYYRVVDSLHNTKLQLCKAERDQERLVSEKDGHLRQLTYTKAELERYQRDNSDLSAQVRELLHCIEKIRRGDYDCISGRQEDGNLLSEDLFLYRNIDELQSQNQRLLSALREAEAKREEMIKAAQDAEMSKLKNELVSAMRELEDVKMIREKQDKLMQSVVDQRDAFEKLLVHKTSTQAKFMPNGEVSPSKSSTVSTSEDANAEIKTALEKLTVEFEVYREQKSLLQNSLSDKVDKLQAQLTETKADNARLNAEVQYEEERFKALNVNTDGYRKEIASLRQRNEQYAAIVAKQEQSGASLTKELISSQENIGLLKAENQRLKERLDDLKSSDARQDQEIQFLRRDTFNQQLLTATLNELQARLERTEAEQTVRLKIDLETTSKERDKLQESLQAAKADFDTFVRQNQAKISTLEALIEDDKRRIARLQEQLAFTDQALAKAEEKCTLHASELNAIRLANEDASVDRFQSESQKLQTRLNNCELRLAEANKTIQDLSGKLKCTEKELEQFKNLSQSFEVGFEEQKKSVMLERSTLTSEVQELQQELASVRADNDKLESSLKESRLALTEKDREFNEKWTNLSTTISMLNERQAQAAREAESSQKREQQLKSDLAREMDAARELRVKLNRESDANKSMEVQYDSLKYKFEETSRKLLEVESKNNQIQTRLANHETIVSETTMRYENEVDHLRSRADDLEGTNRRLAAQLEKLSSNLAILEIFRIQGPSTPFHLGDPSKIVEDSCGSLSEVIKHLRHECAKKSELYELSQTELTRLKSREDLLQQEITNLEDKLNDALTEVAAGEQVMSEKVQLVTKLEDLSKVHETNQSLLNDKTHLEEELIRLTSNMKGETDKVMQLTKEKHGLALMINDLKKSLETVRQDSDEWKNKHKTLLEARSKFEAEELSRMKEEMAQVERQFSEASVNLELVKNENNTLKGTLELLQEEKNALEKENIAVAEKSEEYMKQNELLKKIGQKYKALYAANEDKIKKLEANHQSLQKQFETANKEKSVAEESLAALNVSTSSDQKDMESLRISLASMENELKQCKDEIERIGNEKEQLAAEKLSLEGLLEEKECRLKLILDLYQRVEKGSEESQEKPSLREKAVLQKSTLVQAVPAMPVTPALDRTSSSIQPGPSGVRPLRQGASVASIPPLARSRTTATVTPTTISTSPALPDQSFMAAVENQLPLTSIVGTVSTSSQSVSFSTATPSSQQMPLFPQPTLPHAVVLPTLETAQENTSTAESVEISQENQASTISSSIMGTETSSAQHSAVSLQLSAVDIPSTSSKRRQSFVDILDSEAKRTRPLSPEHVSTSGQRSSSLAYHRQQQQPPIHIESEADVQEADQNSNDAIQVVESSNAEDNEVVVIEEESSEMRYDDEPQDQYVGHVQHEWMTEGDDERMLLTSDQEVLQAFHMTSHQEMRIDFRNESMGGAFSTAEDRIEPPTLPVIEHVGEDFRPSGNEAASSSAVDQESEFFFEDMPVDLQQQPQSSDQADFSVAYQISDDVLDTVTSEALAVVPDVQEEQEPTVTEESAEPSTSKTKWKKIKLLRRSVPSTESAGGETTTSERGQATADISQAGQGVSAEPSSSATGVASRGQVARRRRGAVRAGTTAGAASQSGAARRTTRKIHF